MESRTPGRRRKDIGLVVLSAVDVLTGILSLVFATLAVQVIAIMSSGLTLMKAVKVAVQSEKTALLVKPVAVYAVRRLTRSEAMKEFFKKIKENIKNNPLTMAFSFVELLMCGGLGYALIDFVERFPWAVGWKLYAIAFGGAAVIYAILLTFTVKLGHDSNAFAAIRRLVKSLGGEKAVEILDIANAEVQEAVKEEAARKAAAVAEQEAKEKAEADRIAEEQRIYEYALARENEKKAAEEERHRHELVIAYKGEYKRKVAESASEEVSENGIDPHNL